MADSHCMCFYTFHLPFSLLLACLEEIGLLSYDPKDNKQSYGKDGRAGIQKELSPGGIILPSY